MNLKKRSIKTVTLHGTIHTPTGGTMGPTLTVNQNALTNSCEFELVDGFVIAKGMVKSKKFEVAIPLTNVTHITLDANESQSKD